MYLAVAPSFFTAQIRVSRWKDLLNTFHMRYSNFCETGKILAWENSRNSSGASQNFVNASELVVQRIDLSSKVFLFGDLKNSVR